MKKFFKFLGIPVLVIVLAIGAFASFIAIRGIPKYEVNIPQIADVEVTPARVERGAKIASMLCQSCHMNDKTQMMTGKYMIEIPEFGTINAKNITNDKEAGIGSWTDAQLIYFIRTGIHPVTGQYVPIYMPKLIHISDEDMRSIVAYLRSDRKEVQASKEELPECKPSFLTKFLCTVAFKPFEYPKDAIPDPDTTNQLAWGKYLTLYQLECYTCHSKSFEGLNMLEPELSEGFFGGGNTMTAPDGSKITSLNITPDEETGIGRWTEEKFTNALRSGIIPGHPALRQPMMPYVYLTDSEIKAIYTYLQTVPKIKNKVERGI
jgi:cytochrome c2